MRSSSHFPAGKPQGNRSLNRNTQLRTPLGLLLLALGALTLWSEASHPGRAAAAQKEPLKDQVRLVLPKDVRTLPKLPSERFTVYAPQVRQTGEKPDPAWSANTYQHNPLITWWKGRFYCAWTTSLQSEGTTLGGLIASSPDAEEWSPALQLSGLERLVPRGWHQTEDRLYLWTTASPPTVYETADGKTWSIVPPESVKGVNFAPSNKKFLTLRDGRVMAFGLRNGAAFPITKDPTGLTGWTGGDVDSRDCRDTGEPGGWEGRDGTLHGAIRFDTVIWHTYSRDRGQTWSKLAPQPGFPDSPGNKEFGSLPDGSTWYVGNPKPGSRMELVLGISNDGWTFDRNYLIRWENVRPLWFSKLKSEDRAGYEYPAAVYHNGALYITYSRTRDYIEVCRVPISHLLKK